MTASRTRWRRIPGVKDTVLVAGSLSKTYAMTGWRIGFVLGPAPVVGGIEKLQSHATSNPTSIRAEGRDRSAARAAGIGGHHAGGV